MAVNNYLRSEERDDNTDNPEAIAKVTKHFSYIFGIALFLLLFFQGYGGKSFEILTDEELLNYLSSNISKEEKTPPLNAEDLKNMNMSELVSTMQPYVQSFNR